MKLSLIVTFAARAYAGSEDVGAATPASGVVGVVHKNTATPKTHADDGTPLSPQERTRWGQGVPGRTRASSCKTLSVVNSYYSGYMNIAYSAVNGESYWVSMDHQYGMWHDGDSGSSFDWVFGPIGSLGQDDQHFHSNNQYTNPYDVSTWYTGTGGTADPIGSNVVQCATDGCSTLDLYVYAPTHGFDTVFSMYGYRNSWPAYTCGGTCASKEVYNDGDSDDYADWYLETFGSTITSENSQANRWCVAQTDGYVQRGECDSSGERTDVSVVYVCANMVLSTLVDECSTGAHNCHADAWCTDETDGWTCGCNSGYTGDGISCSDLDECATNYDNCNAYATCSNTVGSFSCSCNSGYNGDGVYCYDDDECNLGTDNCHADATCSNYAGSFSCACNSGTTGDGLSCSDIDECSSNTHNCDTTNGRAYCRNTYYTFVCECNVGYTGDGVTCTDDDECAMGKSNCAHLRSTCTNTPGSFDCSCDSGYTGDGVTCTDIDECGNGTDNCDADATCANTDGSFICTCNTGYSGDGVTCTDIDECATGTDNCDANGTCTNTVGSFTCACNQEYNGDGVTCTAYAGPCPSQTCWTWDAANNKCDLNPGCSTVECGATSMTMYFNKWLLNSALTMSNGIAGLSPSGAVANNNTAYPDMDYSLECTMGGCNMQSSIVGSDLILAIDVAQDGSDRVRSASDNEITLNGVTIETAPHGVSVTFSCSYDTSVVVDSAAFDVHDVAIHGDTQGTGDLKAGFSMAFTNAASSGKFILGGVQGVHVTWSVSLTGVTFFLDSCNVVDGSASLAIVKGACYSDVLKSTRLTQAAGVTDVQSLEYKTFQLKGSTGTGLKVQCTVTICNSATSCADPTTCPATGGDAAYGYSVNGFNGPRISSDWTTNTP